MRAKEFGAWLSRKMDKSGRRNSGDEYNKSFKGEWPPKRYDEFASCNMDEYHRYPETKDLKAEEENQQENTQSSQSSKQNNKQNKSSKRMQNSPGRLVQNLVGRVVAVSVGAVVVANSYVAMGGELPFELPFTIFPVAEASSEEPDKPNPVNLSTSWEWSDDKQTATLKLVDEKGTTVREIPAVVTVTQEDATCTSDAIKTYTATAEVDGTSYSDSDTEITAKALGHIRGEWTETILEGGKHIISSECTRCHESFAIEIQIGESD